MLSPLICLYSFIEFLSHISIHMLKADYKILDEIIVWT